MMRQDATSLRVDPLESRFLETRAEMEFARTTAEAENHARVDLEALGHLKIIALNGARTEEARKVLACRLAHLGHIVRRPPVELGLVGEHAKHMNLEQLRQELLFQAAHECNAVVDQIVVASTSRPRPRTSFAPSGQS